MAIPDIFIARVEKQKADLMLALRRIGAADHIGMVVLKSKLDGLDMALDEFKRAYRTDLLEDE